MCTLSSTSPANVSIRYSGLVRHSKIDHNTLVIVVCLHTLNRVLLHFVLEILWLNHQAPPALFLIAKFLDLIFDPIATPDDLGVPPKFWPQPFLIG